MTFDDIQAASDPASEKAKSSVRASRDKAAVATSQALHGAQEAIQDPVQGASDEAGAVAASVFARAKDAVQGLSGSLPSSAAEAYRSGQRAYTQGAGTVADRVARQPIEALLLAGALGYLVGWATSRG